MSWARQVRSGGGWLLRSCASAAQDRLRAQRARRDLLAYERGGRVPWTPGYLVARERAITEALGDRTLLAGFRDGAPLPPGHGRGFDERLIEYPWLFAQLASAGPLVLDAGAICNHEAIVEQPLWREKTLHITTLAPEGVAFPERGISYLFADLRDLPLRAELYDAVACISTLEHVGFDNTSYSGQARHAEHDPAAYLDAVRELARVLKPGGTLLLSVPFGHYEVFAGFRQFDGQTLDEAIEAFAPAEVEKAFYRYTASGWQRAEEAACADSRYVRWTGLPAAEREAGGPREPDLAAAARAVACVRLVKA